MTTRGAYRLHHLPHFAVFLCIILILAVAGASAASPPAPAGPAPVSQTETGSPGAVEGAALAGPLLSYQGRLVNPSTGNPLSGTFQMTFRLWDAATGGSSALWTETKTNVQVTNGLFSTLLGESVALNLAAFDGRDLWLGVQVGSDAEATPRIPVAYAPYAIRASTAANAANADRLGGNLPNAYAAAAHNHNAVNITDGTLNTARYSAVADLMEEGMLGNASGDIAMNNGYLQPTLNADLLDNLHGTDFAAAGHNHLGQAWMQSTDSNGLVLEGTVSWANSLLQAFNHSSGPSIWGINDGGGNALRGQGGGNSLGVYGQAENAAGVAGRSSGSDGVAGVSSAYGMSGVWGNHEGNGPGVSGTSQYGTGVSGSSEYGWGVYGKDGGPNPDDSFAVWADGDVRTTGDLTVGLTLYVGGYATFAGGKGGFVVDIAQNDDAEPLIPGDVVSISGAGPAVLGEIPVIKVRRATTATATGVVGVVDGRFARTTREQASGAGGVVPEKVETTVEAVAVDPGQYLTVVTLGAYKAINVDAAYGPISPGDLLVASPHPGYAMRSVAPLPGTIIGKSLGSLAEGAGMVPVMITLQ
jgi:hypothetical protein